LSQSDAAVAGDPAIIRRPRLERVGSSDAGSAKKETGPARARLQFIGARPTITFQRGTAVSVTIAIWEDEQPGC
jgi:hypothetical protein